MNKRLCASLSISAFLLAALVCLVLAPFHVHAQPGGAAAPLAPGGWSAPAPIGDAGWPSYLRYFSLNDDATRLVALHPTSGGDDNSRHILVSERVGGAWQSPVMIAQNGAYSDSPYQTLPQRTHPVISGDGDTIVYVGYTGTTFGAYVVDRLPGGGWSAPALIPAGLANVHYWISLSQDGKTLALCDYPYFGIQHVYVLTRAAGGWSAPVRVSAESGPLQGGGMPSLSADGTKLVYIQNARVTFVERVNGQWGAPQQLTTNHWWEYTAEFPQLSGDGRAIYYWLVRLVRVIL